MPFNRSIDWNPFVRHVAGESDDDEARSVLAQVAVDEEKGRAYEEVQRVWAVTRRPRPLAPPEPAWARLHARIAAEAATPPPRARMRLVDLSRRPPEPPRLRAAPARARARAWIGWACVLAAVGAALLVPSLVPPTAAPEPEVREVVTQPGQRASLRLADGTHVRMNVDSRLTFPVSFQGDRRVVHLEGEALFEVARDEQRPFFVETEEALVEVLGTQFDVRAYGQGEGARVVVVEGSVSVRPSEGEQDVVVLGAQDVLALREGELHLRRGVDLGLVVGWLDGRLVFRAAPFDEVAAQLERTYDLRIELDGAPQSVGLLNASFGDEPLSEILKAVAIALDLRFERERRTVRFFPRS